MKKIEINKKTTTNFNSNDISVARILGKARVQKSSYFVTGSGKYINKMAVETIFSTETDTSSVKEYPNHYPLFVRNYVNKNPRVQKVVYSKNTRIINKILSNI